jgi:hypothetical protein
MRKTVAAAEGGQLLALCVPPGRGWDDDENDDWDDDED